MFFLGLMFEGDQDHEISINLWQTISQFESSQYHQTHIYFLCIQAVQRHTFPTVNWKFGNVFKLFMQSSL